MKLSSSEIQMLFNYFYRRFNATIKRRRSVELHSEISPGETNCSLACLNSKSAPFCIMHFIRINKIGKDKRASLSPSPTTTTTTPQSDLKCILVVICHVALTFNNNIKCRSSSNSLLGDMELLPASTSSSSSCSPLSLKSHPS